MKKLLKLMIVITFGMLLFSSCQEGETSMPEMNAGAVKNVVSTGDPLILVDNPAAFDAGLTLDIISDDEVASVDVSIVFVTASGAIDTDTALITTVTSFPYELNLSLQFFADQFPASSNYILNSLEGGDNFQLITGNVFMADGREILDEYEFMVQDSSETTGNDTLVPLDATGNSPALENIMTGVWPQQLTYYVGCPFDPTEAAGTYTVVEESWWEEYYMDPLTGRTVEVVAGPGENQCTIIDPFKFDEDFGSGPYEVIVEVDPAGFIFATVDRQMVCHFDASAPPFNWGYGPGYVEGGGLVLSCIGKIELNWELTVGAGGFGTFSYKLEKN